MGERVSAGQYGMTHNEVPDPWECHGFRVVPCMNADSVWVDIETPQHEGEPLAVELAPKAVRELAEFLTRVADTAEAWRGSR